jgi:DnaJ like chaperone protein
MGWWGKAVGGTLGLLVGGPWGAVLGATLGHGLDRGAEQAELFGSGRAERARLQGVFVETTFKVMGHLAKSDGRVSETEIAFAESVMTRMGLDHAGRRMAIQFFNQGKAPAFTLVPAVTDFRRASSGQTRLHQIFLEIQLAAVYVHGAPAPAERLVLEQIRAALQFPAARFRQVERVIQIQYQILGAGAAWGSAGAGGRTRGERPGRGPAVTPVAGAYAVLGVTPQASDAEVKRAYRLLMNEHHPDKLMSRGAPTEALKMAAQKTHEIRQAYETITRARGT